MRWSKQSCRRKRAAWVKKQTDRIEVLQERVSLESMEEIRHVQASIDDKLERVDLKWKQRAKVH
jgi:hypothetical protein